MPLVFAQSGKRVGFAGNAGELAVLALINLNPPLDIQSDMQTLERGSGGGGGGLVSKQARMQRAEGPGTIRLDKGLWA